MYYRIKLADHIRLPPELFKFELKEAIIKQIKTKFDGFISKELGIVIDVASVGEVSEGVIIPGDGAPYYKVDFELLTFRPELKEILPGKIRDIADFGAFVSIGPIDGMVHISQTMVDFVSFGKDKVLLGKETNKSLKVNDIVRSKIIAISYKDVTNPKIGLTMRQEGLGKLEWIEEDLNPDQKKTAKKAVKTK